LLLLLLAGAAAGLLAGLPLQLGLLWLLLLLLDECGVEDGSAGQASPEACRGCCCW
jgi:hypothetical protein